MKSLTSSLLVLLFAFFCFAHLTRADEKKTDKPTTQPTVKKISVDEFDKMRQDKEAMVLDVRTPREFEAGHVPGAGNIPIASPDFKQQISQLDKTKIYLLHRYPGSRNAAPTQ